MIVPICERGIGQVIKSIYSFQFVTFSTAGVSNIGAYILSQVSIINVC